MNYNDKERIQQKDKQQTDRDAEQKQHKTSVETIAKWLNARQRNKYNMYHKQGKQFWQQHCIIKVMRVNKSLMVIE